jgi:hypothetical protein
MGSWQRGLAALGSAASLALFCVPAQAQICGEPGEAADALVEFYGDEFEDFFPQDEKPCEQLAKTFLKACNSAVKDAAKCAERQLDAIPKAAKSACEGTKNPSDCVGTFEDDVADEKDSVADEADEGFADCENNAGLLFVFCRVGPDT